MIEIEDDTLREGLQSVASRRPSVSELLELVEYSVAVGVQHLMLGFPIVSTEEYSQITTMLEYICANRLRTTPWVLSRMQAHEARLCRDLFEPFQRLRPGVAVFRAISEVREQLEGWNTKNFQDDFDLFVRELEGSGLRISLNLEDVTRARPDRLFEVLAYVKGYPIESLALCDTVGCAQPAQVKDLVTDVRKIVGDELRLIWHGHNDLGLAHANSLAALEAGVDVISGTFLGIGERAGNSPLEQILLFLNLFADEKYNLPACQAYCDKLRSYMGLEIAPWTPVVGKSIHATQTGTHIAAILKARSHDQIDSETIFSAYSPSVLGRTQELVLGPLSGTSMARHVLRKMGYEADDVKGLKLLNHAKKQKVAMSDSDIRKWLREEEANESF